MRSYVYLAASWLISALMLTVVCYVLYRLWLSDLNLFCKLFLTIAALIPLGLYAKYRN